MEAVIEQALGIVEEARRNGGLASLLVTVFPALLLLEVPLNLLVLLGVLRWFLRKPYELPPDNAYRPRVSCIITCYSEGLDVQSTLRSLCEQTYLGDIEMIPVVDGAAVNKTTMQAVRDFRLDRVLYPRRLLRPIAKWQRGGRVSSLNAGLAHCTGEIVMSLDGDTAFDNDMVVNIVRHFADPNVPAVAGSLRVRNWKASLTTAMQALEYLLSIHMAKIGLSEWNLVNNVSGAFGAFRRSFLDKIGGWDTHTPPRTSTSPCGSKTTSAASPCVFPSSPVPSAIPTRRPPFGSSSCSACAGTVTCISSTSASTATASTRVCSAGRISS